MTKDTKLSLALLDSIIICGQCGALFLSSGWSNETHNAWHRETNSTAPTVSEQPSPTTEQGEAERLLNDYSDALLVDFGFPTKATLTRVDQTRAAILRGLAPVGSTYEAVSE